MLELLDLSQLPIVQPVNETFEAGKLIGLVGPNGAGKSTLLKTIAGLLPATGGEVCVSGQSIRQLSPKQRAKYMSYMPQSLSEDVPFTVREYVEMGRYSHGSQKQLSRAPDVVNEALSQIGLTEHAAKPLEMISGGERQRAGIARCLAQGSPVMLLDEPISNLDIYYQLEILTRLADLAKQGYLVVMAIHHLEFALQFCDELVVLLTGEVYARGPVCDVFTSQMLRDVFRIDAQIFVDPIHNHPRLSIAPPSQKQVLRQSSTEHLVHRL